MWLSEGIFERYWTKKYKKKGQIEVNNPPKESMSKVGLCTVVVEPHVFETTVFIVREAQPQIDSTIQQPKSSQGLSDAAKASQAEQPAATSTQSSGVKSAVPKDTISDSAPEPASQKASVSTPTASRDPKDQSSVSLESPQQKLPMTPQHTRTGSRSQEQPKPTQSNQDPVIHMLAQRAVSDPSLRTLMRRVADGEASQYELKIFQNHIEELKAQQRAKRIVQRPLAPSTTGPSAASSSSAQPNPSLSNGRSSASDHLASAPIMPRPTLRPPPAPPGQTIKIEIVQRPSVQSSTSTSKSSTNHFKGEIIAVALEFSAGSGDRFLFPKYSILEYKAGGTEVIASFLVLRNGIASPDHSYDPRKEYYQPVTIRMSAHHPRVLEPLARTVASPDKVKDYMNNIMDRAHRLECSPFLVKPFDAEMADSEDEDGEGQAFDLTRGHPKKRQIRV
jgi:hypothetical protein